MKETVLLVIRGAAIGVANIIPGVSGGTMAVVLGVYERLIAAIGGLVQDRARRWDHVRLLAAIGIGAVAAIVALSWLMDYLLTHHEVATYLFFIGLIAGSIPSVYRAHHNMKLSPGAALSFVGGAGLILVVAYAFPQAETDGAAGEAAAAVAVVEPGALVPLFVAGIFAGGSMIVPGISGSFVMVLLGQYHAVIRAIKSHDLVRVAAVGIGALVGVWVFAKLIGWLLRRAPRLTFFFILGLVVASLIPIFPGFPAGAAATAGVVLVALVGAGVSLALGRTRR